MQLHVGPTMFDSSGAFRDLIRLAPIPVAANQSRRLGALHLEAIMFLAEGTVDRIGRLVFVAPRNENVRTTWLRIFLRVLAVGYLVAFIPWITLVLLNAPILAPGGQLAPLLRFQPYNAYYEAMMTAIYIVWAMMMWRAADNPVEHRLFIDFTIWATAAHGLVMIIATPIAKGPVMTVIEALPLLVIAAVLWWLRPSQST